MKARLAHDTSQCAIGNILAVGARSRNCPRRPVNTSLEPTVTAFLPITLKAVPLRLGLF